MTRSSWGTAALGDLVEVARIAADPAEMGDSLVHHFSLPAFDQGARPEHVPATAIKSVKLRIGEPMVLVSRLNPHIPRVWRVRPGDAPALASTEFAPLVPRGVSAEYLYAACLSDQFRRALAARVTGTSTSHQRVKAQDLLAIEIPVPPLEERERIGSIVADLERRREVSNRLAEVGDGLLRELFRSSFRELWGGATPLGELVDITQGVSYRSAELGGTEQALVTLKCFGRDGGYRDVGLKPWSGEAKPGQYVEEGDVVVAHTDLTQAADVLGRAVVVRRSSRFKRLVASLDMAVLRPGATLTREFLLGLARQPEFRRYCRAHANGTTVLHLGRRAVAALAINLPAPADVQKYSVVASPLVKRQLLADDERRAVVQMQALALQRFFDNAP